VGLKFNPTNQPIEKIKPFFEKVDGVIIRFIISKNGKKCSLGSAYTYHIKVKVYYM
jgi:hypothetical protein